MECLYYSTVLIFKNLLKKNPGFYSLKVILELTVITVTN